MDHGYEPKHVEASKNETATSRSTLKRFLAYRSSRRNVSPITCSSIPEETDNLEAFAVVPAEALPRHRRVRAPRAREGLVNHPADIADDGNGSAADNPVPLVNASHVPFECVYHTTLYDSDNVLASPHQYISPDPL
ncbi:uncharacterized protein PG998_013021 [Apiospora kogelbergensis]|uniref:uncharacterized protein n=1 Tax=Apiospora kogelbergensis TaxID=1337665 RepID=UPI003131558F